MHIHILLQVDKESDKIHDCIPVDKILMLKIKDLLYYEIIETKKFLLII